MRYCLSNIDLGHVPIVIGSPWSWLIARTWRNKGAAPNFHFILIRLGHDGVGSSGIDVAYGAGSTKRRRWLDVCWMTSLYCDSVERAAPTYRVSDALVVYLVMHIGRGEQRKGRGAGGGTGRFLECFKTGCRQSLNSFWMGSLTMKRWTILRNRTEAAITRLGSGRVAASSCHGVPRQSCFSEKSVHNDESVASKRYQIGDHTVFFQPISVVT